MTHENDRSWYDVKELLWYNTRPICSRQGGSCTYPWGPDAVTPSCVLIGRASSKSKAADLFCVIIIIITSEGRAKGRDGRGCSAIMQLLTVGGVYGSQLLRPLANVTLARTCVKYSKGLRMKGMGGCGNAIRGHGHVALCRWSERCRWVQGAAIRPCHLFLRHACVSGTAQDVLGRHGNLMIAPPPRM
jgi:hypothetical protein